MAGSTWQRAASAVAAVALTVAAAVAQGPAVDSTPLPPPAAVDILADGTWPFDPPNTAADLNRKPFPGSTADQFYRDYAGRELFRHCCGDGTVLIGFPSTLLWEPPFAAKREPRMMALPTTLNNYVGPWTLDTSLGTTVGLFRLIPSWSPALEAQLDLFGVVHTRLSPDDLIVADYRFGFPVTFRHGPWHAKIAYEHTSAHVGDEGIQNGRIPINKHTTKDEVVFGLGRWFEDCLRLYGQSSYAFYQNLPDDSLGRWRFDIGFELYNRQPTGFWGTPFVALNADFRGDQKYNGNLNVQAGWLWRNPEQRLAMWRTFIEYYNGRSPYGQLQFTRERFLGAGVAADY
jgi:hypothetical protein